ncbi:MAG: hypothetical protein ACXVQU_07485 [Actinomycetota bacterium]
MAHSHPAVRAFESGLSLSRFRRALAGGGDVDHLPPHTDALTPRGRDELLRWLRSWGCRHLRVEDHARTSRALRAWAVEWAPALPRRSLADLSVRQIERSAAAYEALAARPAASAVRATGPVVVTFGPTASAKTLYALRPSAFPPWDAPMRGALRFGENAEAYARYLELCARGVRATARRAGIEPSQLPAALGRPRTTAARLVDEYLWLALTRGARV